MDWNDIRIFLAIARSGTLGAAARSLGLSHPTIGRRLGALETATGRRLFQRTAEGFVLTEDGASIVSLAEQIEEATLGMERRLAGADGALEGTLRIASSDWFGAWMLPPVIAEFSKRHPGVTVELRTEARLSSLAHREADLAFRVVPFDESDVVQRRLLSLSFGVYEAADHPIAPEDHGAQMPTIEDIQTEAFPDVGWLKQRSLDAKVAVRSNNRTVQARLCAHGIGRAVLPRPIGQLLPGLREIDLGEEPPQRTVWMGYHRDLKALGRLRAFVDIAVARLAN